MSTPVPPPPGHRDETPEQKLDRLYAAYSAAQEAEATNERLADAKEATSEAARKWHQANGRIQRMTRKGKRAA